MKKYYASDLVKNAKEKMDLMGNVIGSSGNTNIRGHYLAYFEDRIVEQGEVNNSSIVESPNYYAWLCIFCEHIFWLMREWCMRNQDFDTKSLDLEYTRLIETYFDKCIEMGRRPESEISQFYNEILEVLVLRHSIIHRGFPNLLPEALNKPRSYGKPSMGKGRGGGKFTKEELQSIIRKYSDPRDFGSIKDTFYQIVTFVIDSPGVSLGF